MAELTDVFYGLCTFWTDDWNLMRTTRSQIPRCPKCGAVGFEMDKREWWRLIEEHEAKGHPGYKAMMTWARGKCFPNFSSLESAWRAQEVPS